MREIMFLILLMLLVFLFVGCSNISNSNIPSENDNISNSSIPSENDNISNSSIPSENDIMEDIRITEIDQFNIEWDQIPFSVDFNEEVLREIELIDTNKNAVKIGTNIIEEIHRDGKLSEYTLIAITHSTEDNVWCFEYSIDQRNNNIDNIIDCGCLYVAIDGNKGTLIKAWIEE